MDISGHKFLIWWGLPNFLSCRPSGWTNLSSFASTSAPFNFPVLPGCGLRLRSNWWVQRRGPRFRGHSLWQRLLCGLEQLLPAAPRRLVAWMNSWIESQWAKYGKVHWDLSYHAVFEFKLIPRYIWQGASQWQIPIDQSMQFLNLSYPLVNISIPMERSTIL